jgi:hypothetical protein
MAGGRDRLGHTSADTGEIECAPTEPDSAGTALLGRTRREPTVSPNEGATFSTEQLRQRVACVGVTLDRLGLHVLPKSAADRRLNRDFGFAQTRWRGPFVAVDLVGGDCQNTTGLPSGPYGRMSTDGGIAIRALLEQRRPAVARHDSSSLVLNKACVFVSATLHTPPESMNPRST